MENKSQTSLEYLIMVGIVVIIATLAILLTTRILNLESNVKETLKIYRERIIQIKA